MNPLRALFPKARRPVTPGALAPLLIFGALFGAGIALVEWRGILRFSNVSAFALAAVLRWIWWLHHAGGGGLSRGRALAALLVRFVLVGTFILLLAEPRAVRKSDTLAIVYALDVSDSMGTKVRDQALGWIVQTAKTKPPKDEAGLVVFAHDAAVELPPRTSFPFEAIGSRVTRDGTDLGQALSLAAAILPDESQGRIVLLSDGNETDGSVLPHLDELKSRGIAVDVLPVGFAYEKEVWLERLDLPRVVKLGETYEATVLLNALSAGRGTLRLSENGEQIFEKEIAYEAGKNRFTLPLYLRAPGFYEYTATIEVPAGEDGWKENNLALGDLYLRGEGQVLVVIDARSDARDWEPLVAALKAGERLVQVRMGYELPRDARSLLPYDLIIFANAPADVFDAPQLQAVRDAVYHLGTGLLMLGGPHSFGPGGYHRTAIEEALPVEMDVTQRKALPSGALLIALDRSGSMAAEVGGRTKISLADRGAVLALQKLHPRDYYGVFAVDTQAHEIVPVGRHGPIDDALSAKILGIDSGGGGIYVYTALEKASAALHAVDASLRHVILFADAADAEQQTGSGALATALDLAAGMAAAKITTSVVALGREEDKDTLFLRALAARGGGRFYLTDDPTTLPQIFIKEAITLKRSMLQNRIFTPEVEFPSPVLKGIEALPTLRGYVLTTAKARSSTVLRVPPTAEEPAQIDPVLATWRFGLGTTAAWTSDLGAAWAQDWIGWEKYRAFIQQLAQELSRVERPADLRLSTFPVGSSGIITVEDFAKDDAFLEIAARVTGPGGKTLDVPLWQNGPRRYQGEFPLFGKGRYQIVAAAAGRRARDGAPEQAIGGFAVPYSHEHLRFRSDSVLLQQIATRTGGRVLSATETDIFHPPRATRESTRPIFDWFLIVLACLLPLDVAMRRVQLDWSVIRGWFGFGKKVGDSSETMGALLGRKRRVQTALEQPSAPRPTTPSFTKAPAKPSSPAAPPAATEEASTPLSTTERLLERKRKRKDDQH